MTAEAVAPEQDTSTVVDMVAGLDTVLTDGALGPLRRLVPPAGVVGRLGGRLARQPSLPAGKARTLAVELARVAAGRSQVAPGKKDRRFQDPAWTENWLLRRAMQAHLAAAGVAVETIDEAGLEWADHERLHLAVSNLADALAPSNNPVLNPLAWKAVVDSGGLSVVRGTRRLVGDLARAPRVPSMVEPDAFRVGHDLAVSPGQIVLRTPIFELIEYAATTEQVSEVPLLMIPPTINKYYIADLAPGRSIVEHMVGNGQRVFMVAWRNPGKAQADWGLDDYGKAVLDAMDKVADIVGHRRSALLAFCSGGIITSMVLSHLASLGELDRIVGAGLAVTVLDQAKAGTTSALMDPATAEEATETSRRKGYLDGATLAEVFAWLRPNDLVWNYWVNNYLQGKAPAAFDILFWNADTTRMPAHLHRDFLELSTTNSLTRPGEANFLGRPVDLSKVDVDSYVLAGIADHLCQWQSCYQSTQLLGGTSRFVLSTSGHIASLVNPPGNPKSTWRTAEHNPSSAEAWLEGAETVQGSWWTDFTAWLDARCGEKVDAPAAPGGDGAVLGPAPGTYVYGR